MSEQSKLIDSNIVVGAAAGGIAAGIFIPVATEYNVQQTIDNKTNRIESIEAESAGIQSARDAIIKQNPGDIPAINILTGLIEERITTAATINETMPATHYGRDFLTSGGIGFAAVFCLAVYSRYRKQQKTETTPKHTAVNAS